MRFFAPLDSFEMHYKAPTPEDVEHLKKELGYDGSQMAALFGVADKRAFRRYTSKSTTDKNKREVSAHMLFFAMARLELSAESIDRILDRMRQAGAEIKIDETAKQSAPDGDPQP